MTTTRSDPVKSARLNWSYVLALVMFVLIAAAAPCGALYFQLGVLERVIGLVALILGSVWILRRPVASLLGPVAQYDMMRVSRQGRQYLIRIGYACALLIVLYLLYPDESRLSRHDMAKAAESYASGFMAVQWVVLVLLVPLYTASAITEEKENKTLDFILATHLGDDEIVIGKLLSRLAYLLLLVLTGIPILALVLFMGGVDPNRLMAGFIVTILSMFGLGSVAMLISVNSRSTWTAVVGTYLVALLWLVPPCSPGLLMLKNDWGNESLGAFVALHAVFNLVIGVAACSQAVRELRSAAARAAAPPPRLRQRQEGQRARHVQYTDWEKPPMHDAAMLWKEVYCRPDTVRQVWQTLILVMLVFAGFWLLLVAVAAASPGARDGLVFMERATNGIVRVLGTTGTTILLFIVAVRAASTFSREMEKQTLDSLLTIPDRDFVFTAKWLGTFLYFRWEWAAVLALWTAGFVDRGVSFVGWVFVLLATAVHIAFVASLGTWFSLAIGNTVRAVIFTMGTAFVVSFGFFLLLDYGGTKLQAKFPKTAHVMKQVGHYGTIPPVSTWVLACTSEEMGPPLAASREDRSATREAASGSNRGNADEMGGALLGVIGYLFMALLLWSLAKIRFNALVGEKPANATQ